MTTTTSNYPIITNASLGRPVRILLVEDSPSDVAMTVMAVREARVANEIDVVRDGEKAMSFLHRQEGFADAQRPDIILLDLNLPRMDGREVLSQLKSDPDLATIPIVVLTSSAADADVLRSYQLHANAYVTKPVDVEGFFYAVRSLEDFWLSLVHLPSFAV